MPDLAQPSALLPRTPRATPSEQKISCACLSPREARPSSSLRQKARAVPPAEVARSISVSPTIFEESNVYEWETLLAVKFFSLFAPISFSQSCTSAAPRPQLEPIPPGGQPQDLVPADWSK